MTNCVGVVLAAGKGTRMKSKMPKLMLPMCGRGLLSFTLHALAGAGIGQAVLVVAKDGSGPEPPEGLAVRNVIQEQPLGTGHALGCAAEALLGQADHILVLNGDLPLVKSSTLAEMLSQHIAQGAAITLLTAASSPAAEMGRVLRDSDGNVCDIVETKDSGKAQPGAWECNGGAYFFEASWLWENLPKIEPSDSGEIYVTSLISAAYGQGAGMGSLLVDDPTELLGVNTRSQLALAEEVMRERIRQHWMDEGVAMIDPRTTFLDADVRLGQDTVIYPNTMVLGKSTVGEDCTIGPGSTIRDSQVGDRCRVVASFLTEAVLESDVSVGPYCHLRSGTHLEEGVHVGTFAEIKNSRLGQGTAMGHFGYVGDATVGADVNLGAGTVTCNYDGESKHPTTIGDNAFIGSDTMLVAPVDVGPGAATGAGAVVTHDVPPSGLAVGVPARIVGTRKKPAGPR